MSNIGNDRFMLPTTAAPFSREGWLFELKHDGWRVMVGRQGGEPFIRSRAGHDITVKFPEVVAGLRRLGGGNCEIDAELVVLTPGGESLQAMRQRGHYERPEEIEAAADRMPAAAFCFDLLSVETGDIRHLPLRERKLHLRGVVPQGLERLRLVDSYEEHGERCFDAIRAHGGEGIVAKRADSKYAPGRTRDWLKIYNPNYRHR